MVDVKNDNVQTTCYTEHESICKSTHGSMVKVLCEGNQLEQIQREIMNSCSGQGVENTLNFTGNANIVNLSVMTNVMQPAHGKRRVSLGNEGIFSTVKKTLVRDVGMGWKFGQAFKSADIDVNFLSIMPSVSIETNAATAVGSMKANIQTMNNAATAVVSNFQSESVKATNIASVKKSHRDCSGINETDSVIKCVNHEKGDMKEIYECNSG